MHNTFGGLTFFEALPTVAFFVESVYHEIVYKRQLPFGIEDM